jgi:hypothetical protein
MRESRRTWALDRGTKMPGSCLPGAPYQISRMNPIDNVIGEISNLNATFILECYLISVDGPRERSDVACHFAAVVTEADKR